MPPQRHQSKGFTLVELVLVIAIIVTVLGFMVAGASARLDQAAVNRDIADMETLLGAGKALWTRKVTVKEDTSKTFLSDEFPENNGARLCTATNNCTLTLSSDQDLTSNNWIRFDISTSKMTDWLNDAKQLSGQLPEQFAGRNHQNSAYFLFLKEHMVEVSVCLSQDISVDETYVRNRDECRGDETLMEMRLSTSARNARLTF